MSADRAKTAFALTWYAGMVFLGAAVGSSVRNLEAQAHGQEATALEKRVAALEREVENLRKHVDSKVQRGAYRMGEIEASVRECEKADVAQDKRLDTGKEWMTELQRGYVDLLERIIRLHPDEKTPESLRRLARERERGR